MEKFSELVVRFRYAVIVIVLGLCALGGWKAKDLQVESDILKYLPEDDPLVMEFDRVGEKFGGNYLAMVAIETDDVFTHETLSRIREMTREFEKVDGLSDVTSITNILDFKKTEWGVEVGKLIDRKEIPNDPEELSKLRNYTLSKKMYRGGLVSENGRISVIICRLREGTDKLGIGHQLKEIAYQTAGGKKLYFAGIPFQMISINEIIFNDLKFLTPLVVLLVVAVLFFSFRNLRGVLLPLTTVLLSVTCALGIMSAFGIPLTMISNSMPVLLIAIGTAYCIHMINRYQQEVSSSPNKLDALKKATREIGPPIIMAGVTTLIGFLSFATSDLSLIRQFGYVSAFGILAAIIISITFIPAVLSILKPPAASRRASESSKETPHPLMEKLSSVVVCHPVAIISVAGVIAVVSALGIPWLSREVNMVAYFKKGSELRQAEEMMEKYLGGSLPLQVVVRGEIKNPFVQKEILALEKYLDILPDVNDPQSVADLIAEMNDVMNGHYTSPDTREGVGNLYFMIEGQSILDMMIDADEKEAVIQAKIGKINTKVIIETVRGVNEYLDKEFSRELMVYDLRALSEQDRRKVREVQASKMARWLSWHAQKRNPDWKVDEAALQKKLARPMSDTEIEPGPEAALAFHKRLTQYFTGDEADITIDTKENQEGLISALDLIFRSGKNPSDSEIRQALEKALVGQEEAPGEEDLDYAVESLSTIFRNYGQLSRLHHLMGAVNPDLPPDWAEDPEFKKDVISDLWEVNDNYVALPKEKALELLGGISPAEEVKIEVNQAGLPMIFKDLDQKLLKSQLESLGLALVMVFILLALQFRSIVAGLIGIVPIGLCVLINFGVMAYTGIALDNATVMIASVAIGIGIDYSIHFLSRFRLEMASDRTPEEAIFRAHLTTGRAIIINAASVMMGFLVFLLGSLVPMQYFGSLMALTMITSSLGALMVLPALLLVTHSSFVARWREVTNNAVKKIVGGEKQ
ncbi:MAG: RND family transporter [Deltaproteobacteria bacterium]|nr:RND family transporter [Deltaproteobacteria bacterium]